MSQPPYLPIDAYSHMVDPPFDYDGVVSRVFPLRADMGRLQSFCDDYLNLAPDFAHFEPLIPYVDLVILNYAEMTSQVEGAHAVLSQNEILFQVPLLWTDMRTGKKRHAVVDPYIFVDNEVSAAAGRELYGWPKERAWFEPAISTWAYNPTAKRRLISVGVSHVTPQGIAPRTLFDIVQDDLSLATDFSRFPFISPSFQGLPPFTDPARGPEAIASLLQRCMWLGVGAFKSLQLRQGGDRKFPRIDRESLKTLSLPRVNAINLKQFADAVEPGRACYQALTNTPLEITRVERVGLVGERNQLMMDPTGGCRVRIADDPTRPIVRRLGLVVESEETTYLEGAWPGSGGASGQVKERIFSLKPEGPYWMENNIHQEPSVVLCRRSWGTQQWHMPQTSATSSSQPGASSARDSKAECPAPSSPCPAPPSSCGHSDDAESRPKYSGVLGMTLGLALGSPLLMNQVSIRHLKLAADREKLEAYIAPLNQLESPWTVELMEGESSVTLMVWGIKGMTANTTDLPWFNSHVIGYYIPVTLRHTEKNITHHAFYPAYSFADRATYVHASREMFGGNLSFAEIEAGEDPWLDSSIWGQRDFLSARTLTVQQFGLDEKATVRPIMDISSVKGGGPADAPVVDHTAFGAYRFAKDLLLSDLVYPEGPPSEQENQGVIKILRLKQFPDASDMSKAAYQGLVLTNYEIQRWDSAPGRKLQSELSLRREEGQQGGEVKNAVATTYVRIFDYQSHPIRHQLGLLDPQYFSVAQSESDESPLPVQTEHVPGVSSHLFRSEYGYRWFQAPLLAVTEVLWSCCSRPEQE